MLPRIDTSNGGQSSSVSMVREPLVSAFPILSTSESPGMEIPEDVKSFATYKVAVILEYCILPIISFFGLAGNILSLIVVTQKQKRHCQFYIYLAVLAIADSGTLINVSIFWAAMVSGAALPWLCSITGYLAQVSAGISAWIVVAVTIDRYMAINNPLRYRNKKTPKLALKITLGITLSSVVLSIPHMLTAEVIQDIGCANLTSTNGFVKVYALISVFLFSIIPFIIIFSLNLQIVLALKGRAKLFSSQRQIFKGKVIHWRPFRASKKLTICHNHKRDKKIKVLSLVSIKRKSNVIDCTREDERKDVTALPQRQLNNKKLSNGSVVLENHEAIYSIADSIDDSGRDILPIHIYHSSSHGQCSRAPISAQTEDNPDLPQTEKEQPHSDINIDKTMRVIMTDKSGGQQSSHYQNYEVNANNQLCEQLDQTPSTLSSHSPLSNDDSAITVDGDGQVLPSDLSEIQIALATNDCSSQTAINASCQVASSRSSHIANHAMGQSADEDEISSSANNPGDPGENKVLERQLALMLLGISLAFLILTLPQYVRYFMFAIADYDSDPATLANFLLLYGISNKLYILNNSINFYIYALTGSTFRKDLKQLHKCSCR